MSFRAIASVAAWPWDRANSPAQTERYRHLGRAHGEDQDVDAEHKAIP
jgi:hypothetical protein